MNKYEGLVKYLTFVNKTYMMDICINDFIGFFNDNELYQVLQPFLIHRNSFCMQIKSDRVLWDRCLSMKKRIRTKCSKLGRTYYGLCYCGVGEFIVPIKCDDIVIGVICSGEFNSHPEISRHRINKIARQYHMDAGNLKEKFEASTQRTAPNIELVNSLLGIAAEYLAGIYSSMIASGKLKISEDQSALNTEAYILSHALLYIRENYCEKITLNSISSFCHYSNSYISHIFKKKMKTNIKNYINRLRMEHAKKMLLETKCPVAGIASTVGFDDPNYFSCVFRGITGLTPSEYRNRGYI